MFGDLSRTLTLVGAIGAGVSGGVFFAFSTFVMPALGNLTDRQGLAAMQSINKAAPNPLFMLVLFGTAAVCVGLGISAARHLGEPAARYQLVGCVLFLAAIILTAAYHVPHNNALALLDPSASGSGSAWRTYLTDWTRWNHLRTLTSIGSAAALTVAFRLT